MSDMKRVQAFIDNMTTPSSLDELYNDYFVGNDVPILPDKLLYAEKNGPIDWTVPKWARVGDIVFFMFAKSSSVINLRSMLKEFNKRKNKFDYEESFWIKFWLNHGFEMHKLYGGKIFAVGRVVGEPYEFETSGKHWTASTYARIDDIVILKQPIDISEFRDFIMVSRYSAITGVFGDNFASLMAIIEQKNRLPKMYRNLVSEKYND